VFRRHQHDSDDQPPGSRLERGRRRGPAELDQERVILSALQALRDTSVREVMTPHVDVVGLPIPVHAADVARAVRQTGHSSFPVYDDDLDHIIGILFVNDLFRAGWELDTRNGNGNGGGNGHESGSSMSDAPDRPSPLDISRRLRQPYMVPESRLVLDVLADMRRDRRAFALMYSIMFAPVRV